MKLVYRLVALVVVSIVVTANQGHAATWWWDDSASVATEDKLNTLAKAVEGLSSDVKISNGNVQTQLTDVKEQIDKTKTQLDQLAAEIKLQKTGELTSIDTQGVLIGGVMVLLIIAFYNLITKKKANS